MGNLLYILIFLLQTAVLVMNLSLLLVSPYPPMFYASAIAFMLSVILMIAAALMRIQGFVINCFTAVLLLVNAFLYMIFLFGGYLEDYSKIF